MKILLPITILTALAPFLALGTFAATPMPIPAPNAADGMFAEYFRVETERLATSWIVYVMTVH